jgi:PAS domain S-box-containing protein
MSLEPRAPDLPEGTPRSDAQTAFFEAQMGPEKRVLPLLEAIRHGILCQDAEGAILAANPMAERILGLSLAQMQGRTSIDPRWRALREDGSSFPGEEHPAMVALRTGQPQENIVMGVFNPVCGETRWIQVSAAPIFRPGEARPFQVMASFVDITEHKLAQAALRESEERYRRITEGLTDYQYRVRVEQGRAVATTHGQGCETVTGYSAEDFAADPYLWFQMIPAEDREAARNRADRIMAGEEVAPFEHRILHKNGTLRWVSDTCIPNRDAAGNLLSFDGVVKDITARKEAEQALRDSEGRFRELLQSVDFVAVQGYAPDGTTHYWNRASEQLYGYRAEEALGRNLVDLIIPPEMREGVELEMRHMQETGQTIPSSELSLLRKDGSRVSVFSSHAIVRVPGRAPEMFCMDIDLTDRKQAEEERRQLQAQLLQAQKMDSLGSLAGGVAHDMNNVLGAILGLASAHLEIQPPDSPAYRAFDTIAQAATRGGKMVKSLLNFARQSPAEERELDLNGILREEVRLLERTTLAKVRLEMELASELQPMRGDANALTHAFMNLCVNAVDAMPENGTLTLRTRNVDSEWLEVIVEDTGSGMTKEVLEKALDPFFTTKAHGKGTGLGLAMVYSTVKAHRGEMEIHSAPDQGTRVRLRFPTCEALIPAAEPEAGPDSKRSRGQLNILVVDDDELIQSTMQALLEVLGHHATGAASGEQALAKLGNGHRIDAVILDLNMPGLGGAGTLPRLRAEYPRLPVLLATGRADQTAQDLIEAHPLVTLLHKPFTLKELQQHLEGFGPAATAPAERPGFP